MNWGDSRLPERFWSKVAPCPMSGCWLWTAALSLGYGKFGVGQRVRSAYRYAYEMLVGAVPNGLELDHRCRVRCCVNPAHLEPVTHAENIRRGDSPAQLVHFNRVERIRPPTCPAGHQFDEKNTRITPKGHRKCRACHREREREARRWAL